MTTWPAWKVRAGAGRRAVDDRLVLALRRRSGQRLPDVADQGPDVGSMIREERYPVRDGDGDLPRGVTDCLHEPLGGAAQPIHLAMGEEEKFIAATPAGEHISRTACARMTASRWIMVSRGCRRSH